MRWADGPFEFGAQRSGMDGGARAIRIHRRRSRGEDHLDTLAVEQFEVGVERARVGVEILPGTELQWD